MERTIVAYDYCIVLGKELVTITYVGDEQE